MQNLTNTCWHISGNQKMNKIKTSAEDYRNMRTVKSQFCEEATQKYMHREIDYGSSQIEVWWHQPSCAVRWILSSSNWWSKCAYHFNQCDVWLIQVCYIGYFYCSSIVVSIKLRNIRKWYISKPNNPIQDKIWMCHVFQPQNCMSSYCYCSITLLLLNHDYVKKCVHGWIFPKMEQSNEFIIK